MARELNQTDGVDQKTGLERNGRPVEESARITWRSLTFQLLAVVVFPLIVLLLGITLGSISLHQNAMRQLVGERDERSARMAATALADQVLRRENEIRTLAGQMAGTDAERAAQTLKGAAYLQGDFDGGLAVLGSDGKPLSTQGDASTWLNDPQAVQDGLLALKNGQPSGVYRSAAVQAADASKTWVLVMALSGDGRSALAGAFYTGPLVERVLAGAFDVSQDASVAVITPENAVAYRQGFNSRVEPIRQHAGVAEAFSGQYGAQYVDVGGSEHVVAYSGVPSLGWALLIEEPWEQVASPLLETTHMAPLVMVPVLLLALVAVFFGIRQIVQPLQALATESGKLGWGDYTAIEKPVGGVAEIRLLQNELIHMARKLRVAQQSLHSYIGAITSGQEEERRRLARELHDDTIQSLIAFKQRVQLVEMDWEGHPVAKALAELETVAEQTIDNLRRMVAALRPIYLEDFGLVTALDMLASEIGKVSGAQVSFTRSGKERRFDGPVELALYRIIQEALSNVARHSGASTVKVRMDFQKAGVRIEIEDNGRGFQVPRSPAEFAPSGHFGLLGMFERADLIGGKIQIDSKPGEGTRLVVLAPYAASMVKKEALEALPERLR